MEKTEPKKQGLRGFLIPLLDAVLFSVFLPVFMYTNNIKEAGFKEVLPLIIIFAGIGAVIFGIVFLCFKRDSFLSTAASAFIILSLSNYALFEKMIISLYPEIAFYKTMLFIVVMIVVVFSVTVLTYIVHTATRGKALIRELAPKALAAALSALIILNIAFAVPSGIAKLAAGSGAAEDAPYTEASGNEKMPNVYYLLFDEYSNSEMIKKYYDYDNSGFDSYLEDKGFAVSENTENGSFFTAVVTANYLNYDYVINEDTDIIEKNRIRKDNRLKELFLSKGYEIIGVGESGTMGILSVTQAENTGSETLEGDSLRTIILKNTVYGAFKNISRDSYNQKRADMLNAANHFERLKPDGKSTFTLLYICSPHTPFLFDGDGNPVDPEHSADVADRKYYLGQYVYITKMMEQIVGNILAQDEDSVIILQSDHGSRNSCVTDSNDKMKPLNAVYYRGEDISEIKGQSGVNTIRIVLNRLFDMNLEILEMTEY